MSERTRSFAAQGFGLLDDSFDSVAGHRGTMSPYAMVECMKWNLLLPRHAFSPELLKIP